MFEQSFVQTPVGTRRAAPVALSLLLQLSVIGTALLIPLLNPEMLPRAAAYLGYLASPPPEAPPPRAQPAGRVTRTASSRRTGALLTPAAMPAQARMIEDPPELPGAGVAGALPAVGGGVAGSPVWNALLSSLARQPAPAPASAAVVKEAARPIPRERIGGLVQDAKILSRTLPEYPALARTLRVEGSVVFRAVIGTNGAIRQLALVSGHPLLVQAAMEAVRQWRYQPTMLNGEPVEVDTVISVSFTLRR